MSQGRVANHEQGVPWRGASDHAWVELQDVIDRALEPFDVFLEEGFPGVGGRVLDIGCGTGATTLSMARRLGPTGLCVGVDLSEAMLAVARARANAERLGAAAFVQGDAQTYEFEPHRFDAVISRFGVMFFADPEAAFVNIRSAARPGAKLVFVATRRPAENSPTMVSLRSAAPLLPKLSVPDAAAPGQFAFADGARVRRILDASGWKDVDVRPLDVTGTLPENDLMAYIIKLGPIGVALQDPAVDEATGARVAVAVRAACEPFIEQGTARFPMACWLVSARA